MSVLRKSSALNVSTAWSTLGDRFRKPLCFFLPLQFSLLILIGLVDQLWDEKNASERVFLINPGVACRLSARFLLGYGFLSGVAPGSTSSVLIEPTANSVSFSSVRFSHIRLRPTQTGARSARKTENGTDQI